MQFQLLHGAGQVHIHLLILRNGDTIIFSVFHDDIPIPLENLFFSGGQLHKMVLHIQRISKFNIPFPDVFIHHEPDRQRIVIPVQSQVIVLIDLVKLIQRVRVPVGGKNILDAKHIVHQLRDAVVAILVSPGLDPQTFAQLCGGCRHSGIKHHQRMAARVHSNVAHPLTVDLTAVKVFFFLPSGKFHKGSLIRQVDTPRHTSVTVNSIDTVANSLRHHYPANQIERQRFFPVPQLYDQEQIQINDQKSQRYQVNVIFQSSQPGNACHSNKYNRHSSRNKYFPKRKFPNMPQNIISHDQQHGNVKESEAVRQSILHMKTVPDIIQHIHGKAQKKKPRQTQFCQPFPDPDPIVHYI